MEQDEQAVVLYDFLYRDSGRITSYYAQIFGSHLNSIEETSMEQQGKEFGGKLDAKIVSGDAKSTSGIQTTTKRVSVPHDVVTADTLSFLMGSDRVRYDIEAAPHGSLILAQGTVVFVDSVIGELAVVAFKEMVRVEQSKPKAQQNHEALQTQKLTVSPLKRSYSLLPFS